MKPPAPTVPPKHRRRPRAKAILPLAQLVAIAQSIFIAIAVWVGLDADLTPSSGFLGHLIVFLVPPVIAFGMAASWHVTLGIAAHAEELHRRIISFYFGLLLFLVGCGTSAWFLTSMIDGTSALRRYQIGYIDTLNLTLASVSDNAEADRKLMSAVDASASAMTSTASSENSGIVSGKSGKGPVFRVLTNASEYLRSKSDYLKQIAVTRDDQLLQAQSDIDDAMHNAVQEDTQNFGISVAHTTSELRAADKIHIASGVSGLGVGLVQVPQVTKALDDISSIAQKTEQNRRRITVPEYVPISTKEAVVTDPQVLPWVIAILIEALPLCMLSLLLAVWREEEEEDHNNGPN